MITADGARRVVDAVKFPTKRLNPVAGKIKGEQAIDIEIEFPTKRLNPVAGKFSLGADLDAMSIYVSNEAT